MPGDYHIRCLRQLGLWYLFRRPVVHAPVVRSNQEAHITVKELAPIVVAAAFWEYSWRGKKVLAQFDNTAAVTIVNFGSTKNTQAMQLRHCLAYLIAMNQFSIRVSHIQDTLNIAADALSRKDVLLFRGCYPQAQQQGSLIPARLLVTLLLREPDWTQKDWTELWTCTVARP